MAWSKNAESSYSYKTDLGAVGVLRLEMSFRMPGAAGYTYHSAPDVHSTPPPATFAVGQSQAFVFESCDGDSFKSKLKLAAMKTAVRKYGTPGNCRISLFGTLVGWLHERSYIPQARGDELVVVIFSERSRGDHRIHE